MGDGVGDGVGLAVAVGDGVGLAVAVGDGVGLAVAVGSCVGEGDVEPVAKLPGAPLRTAPAATPTNRKKAIPVARTRVRRPAKTVP